jgi:hypothetical protein
MMNCSRPTSAGSHVSIGVGCAVQFAGSGCAMHGGNYAVAGALQVNAGAQAVVVRPVPSHSLRALEPSLLAACRLPVHRVRFLTTFIAHSPPTPQSPEPAPSRSALALLCTCLPSSLALLLPRATAASTSVWAANSSAAPVPWSSPLVSS